MGYPFSTVQTNLSEGLTWHSCIPRATPRTRKTAGHKCCLTWRSHRAMIQKTGWLGEKWWWQTTQVILRDLSGWWLNQPIWNKLYSQIESFPQGSGRNKKIREKPPPIYSYFIGHDKEKGSRYKPSSISSISCPKKGGFGSLLKLVLMKKVGWIKATKTHIHEAKVLRFLLFLGCGLRQHQLLESFLWFILLMVQQSAYPPGMYKKPVVNHGRNYLSLNGWSLDFCPSRVFKGLQKISQKVQTSSRHTHNTVGLIFYWSTTPS